MTDQDFFTFEARQGEVVSITVAKTAETAGNFEPAWALRSISGGIAQPFLSLSHFFTLDPNTSTFFCGGLCCRGKCESPPLPASGTFRIQVFDLSPSNNAGDGAGTFDLDLQPVSATFNGNPNGPPSPVCQPATKPIGFGDTLSGSINALGEADTFTFTAAAGTPITVNLRRASGQNFLPVWQLFAPDGTLLALEGPDETICRGSPKCCTGRCKVPALPEPGGTFTIEVFDFPWDGTGGYDLTLTSCGNGTLEAGEACDDGPANGTETSCCNGDCTFSAPGRVCRPPVSAVCDEAETCTGTSASCPADAFAGPDTPCAVQDPCTIKDHCEARSCVPGITVCGGRVRQAARATRLRPAIDFTCDVNRDQLADAARGGTCQAVAFQRSSTAPLVSPLLSIVCTTVREGEADCLSAHRGLPRLTMRQRAKIDSGGSATVRLPLNPRSRKYLEQNEGVVADVCGTIRLAQGRRIGLKCSLELRARADTS